MRFLCFISVLISAQAHAQDGHTTDKLQATARRETTGSLEKFLEQIATLEPNIQTRLLKARLMNTTLAFRDHTQTYPGCSDIETGMTQWRLKVRRGFYAKTANMAGHISVEIVIEISADSEMLEWIRLKNEYKEYSNENISDENIDWINLVGSIKSFTWQKNAPEQNIDVFYTLTIKMGNFTKEDMCISRAKYTFTGPFEDHITELKYKIEEWVRHYMGKGEKPKPIYE